MKMEEKHVEKQNEELQKWCSTICADEDEQEDEIEDSYVQSETDNVSEV